MRGGIAGKVAGIGVGAVAADLLHIVSVEGPRQLIGRVAHRVCTVRASGTVGCDTAADADSVHGGADDPEKGSNDIGSESGFRNTCEVVNHAATKLFVRRWRERWGGFPGTGRASAERRSFGRAVSSHCVGHLVRVDVHPGWRDLGNLR